MSAVRHEAGARDGAQEWPPLITVAARPAWLVWRDRALTMLMWFVFALLLQSEFQFLVDRVSAFTLSEETPDPNWRYFWQLLWPFLRISALLIIGLFITGLIGLYRARRARILPLPPPLLLADEAEAKGMDVEALRRAQTLKRSIVHIDDDGRYTVEG